MREKKKKWLLYALADNNCHMGYLGAFSEIPEKHGFPSTLVYVVRAITMIPCALVALHNIHWKLDTHWKPVVLSLIVGILGSGGAPSFISGIKTRAALHHFPYYLACANCNRVIMSAAILKEKVAFIS